MNQNKNQNSPHTPVMLEEVVRLLAPNSGESYLDLTGGYGGHAVAVLERTRSPEKAVIVDRDQEAADYLSLKFKKSGVNILHKDFLAAAKDLGAQGRQFDLILADLGLSSPHLDKASRGFSFRENGPLDMRMDPRQELTAERIVNDYSADQLMHILRQYGEEPKADRIAKAIVESRPILSTSSLSQIVARQVPKYGKVHPATKVFQALRIAVNDELNQLEQALPLWLDLLAEGGRIAVISFHSLEDRIVKQAFKERAVGQYSAEIKVLTNQPLTAKRHEIVINPRARSAKLRAAVKIKTKEGASSAYSGKKQLQSI